MKPTRSAKQTAISRDPGSRPPKRSARVDRLGVGHLAQVQGQQIGDQRAEHRCQLRCGLREALGEVVLADARLDHEAHPERADRFCRLGEPAAEDAQHFQAVLLGDPCGLEDSRHLRGLQVRVYVGALIGAGHRQPHRPPRGHQELDALSAELRDLGRGVALRAADHPLGGQKQDRALLRVAGKL